MKPIKVLFAGGGTGGHLMPGIAVAAELKRRDAGNEVLFVGSDKPLERSLVTRAGFSFVAVQTRPAGRTVWQQPGDAVSFLRAAWQSRRAAKRFRPDVVVGLGGYGSAGPILHAVAMRLPGVLLEQNVIPGKATRVFARWSEQVCCQFVETIPRLAGAPAVWTGNPLRSGIGACDREAGALRLGLNPTRRTLLVMGGSQGAQALNEAMIAAAPALASHEAVQVIHLAGKHKIEEARRAYKACGLRAVVEEFLDDMTAAYAASDLALSRAGGTSLAELAAAGLPAILVPYPYAADDHQRYNATVFAERNAAVMVPQGELDGERLVELLEELLWDEERLKAMRRGALALAAPRAAAQVADCLVSVVRGRAARAAPSAAAL